MDLEHFYAGIGHPRKNVPSLTVVAATVMLESVQTCFNLNLKSAERLDTSSD